MINWHFIIEIQRQICYAYSNRFERGRCICWYVKT